MNWLWFLGGMIVAVLAIGVGAGLWYSGGKKTSAVESWGHLFLGITAAVIALYLGFQLWTTGGGFFAWLWKLPVAVIAGMVTIVAVDIGLHGDRTR